MDEKNLSIEGYQPISSSVHDGYQPSDKPKGKGNTPPSTPPGEVKLSPPKGGTGEITLKKK
jgi:hypothetical protein